MESEGNAGVQIQVLQTFGWWKNFKRSLFQWEKYFLYVSDFFFFVASIETDLCVATGANDILNKTGKKVRSWIKTKSNNKNYFHYSHYLFYLLNGTSCLISWLCDDLEELPTWQRLGNWSCLYTCRIFIFFFWIYFVTIIAKGLILTATTSIGFIFSLQLHP